MAARRRMVCSDQNEDSSQRRVEGRRFADPGIQSRPQPASKTSTSGITHYRLVLPIMKITVPFSIS